MAEVKYKVQYVPVSELKPHPENPRLIKDAPFENLCKSIKENPEYFETRPVLYNTKGEVFAGNMRLRAAIHLGQIEVPAVLMDIPVAKQRELMIRDNAIAGEWDVSILSAYFENAELGDWGVDVSRFGVFGEETGEDKKGSGGEKSGGEKLTECPHCGGKL